MKKLIAILFLIALMLPVQASAAPQASLSQSVTIPGGPTFWFHKVVRDTEVTISVKDFPKGERFQVYIGRTGSSFSDMQKVGTLEYSSGTYRQTYKIPTRYRGERILGIRLYNQVTGHYGHDIFNNTTGWNSQQSLFLTPTGSSTSDSAGTSTGVPGTGPEFWIHDVQKDKFVTIKVKWYPKFENFRAYIGTPGEAKSGGVGVGTIIGSGDLSFITAFSIPSKYWGEDQLILRLENTFTGNYAFTQFTNSDDWQVISSFDPNSVPSFAVSSYRGHPETQILNVVADSEVTLLASNLRPEDTYIVTMNISGTYGIGGTFVGTIESDAQGSATIVTFPIPEWLYGNTVIAIRLESPSSGYYAFDFFYNQDGWAGQ